MKNITQYQLYITVLLLLLFCCFCKIKEVEQVPIEVNYKINLRWSPSFIDETPERAEIGLKWILSYLGATLPTGSFDTAVKWKNEQILTLDVSEVGFSKKALAVWLQLLAPMKASEEYSKMGGIDLGRFYLLTFNSSWHYYALTDVSPTFQDFEEKYDFENLVQLQKGESSITKGCRDIYYSKDTTHLERIAYYAIEGHGDLTKNNFRPVDYEVFDFMPNGQPRFAVYDAEGQLKAAANSNITKAGKPAKCMWCHESILHPTFKKKLTPNLRKLNEEILPRITNLKKFQYKIDSEISFDSLAHHRNGEFAFGSFMECNVSHISNEFQVDSTEFKTFLAKLETHTTPHFPEFGVYYDRNDILQLQPYKSVKVPTHMWEKSRYEPNFLKGNY